VERELKVGQLKRQLYILDETMVARRARRSVEQSVCHFSKGSMVKSDSFYSFQRDGVPGRTRTCGILLGRAHPSVYQAISSERLTTLLE